MAYSILVVDDSTFFRRRVSEILEQDPELTVIGDARNGRQAIEKVIELKPDVVTMDIEMPIMDGITAVREIMAKSPVPILMFSSLTHEGATATLDSLEAGALDFLPKNFEDIAAKRSDAIDLLQSRVKALGRRKSSISRFRHQSSVIAASQPSSVRGSSIASTTRRPLGSSANQTLRSGTILSRPPPRDVSISPYAASKVDSDSPYQVLVIGTSTGGPVALQTILKQLPAGFPYPILLVQHMPANFTKPFAERLNNVCQIEVAEASQGDALVPGKALLAPGGKQMLLSGSVGRLKVKIVDAKESDNVTYKPSVDLTFNSVAEVLGGKVLALILTGMGADGKEGCTALKAKGAKIWAQDEQSSVVYGMPQAVTNAGLAERNLALDDVADSLVREMGGAR